jgi:ketosteroid isomerase-like protein
MRRSAALALAAAPAIVPPAYRLAFKAVLRRNVRRFMGGDVDAFLGLYADDATLTFPGRHSWSGTYRGRREIEQFLQRFRRVGLNGETHDILVQGPPWNTTVCVLFVDDLTTPDGRVIYENRAVVLVKARWGKIVSEEVFEDTQRVAALDEYLEAHEPGFPQVAATS